MKKIFKIKRFNMESSPELNLNRMNPSDAVQFNNQFRRVSNMIGDTSTKELLKK